MNKEICHGRLVSKNCCVLYEFIVCEKTQKVGSSSMNKKLAMADSYQNLPQRNSRKLNLAWTRKIAMADSYLNLPRQEKSCKLNCHDLRTKFAMINKLNLPWIVN